MPTWRGLATGLLLGVAGCSVVDRVLGELPGRVVACDEIVVGMTQKEVEDRLGPPVETSSHERGTGTVRVLEYAAPARGGNRAEVAIGSQSGKVVAVDCKDGFRIPP